MLDFGPDSEAYKKIEMLLPEISDVMNERKKEAFDTVLTNEKLMQWYWHNEEAMLDYFQYFSTEEFQFDYEAFVQVRKNLPHSNLVKNWEGLRPLCLWGKFDGIIDKIDQLFDCRQNR